MWHQWFNHNFMKLRQYLLSAKDFIQQFLLFRVNLRTAFMRVSCMCLRDFDQNIIGMLEYNIISSFTFWHRQVSIHFVRCSVEMFKKWSTKFAVSSLFPSNKAVCVITSFFKKKLMLYKFRRIKNVINNNVCPKCLKHFSLQHCEIE